MSISKNQYSTLLYFIVVLIMLICLFNWINYLVENGYIYKATNKKSTNNIIDTINKYNSENLVNFNNIILNLSGKKEKDINKDKKTLETIKNYIKQRQEIESFTKTLTNNTDIQDEYINYIVDLSSNK